MMTGSSEREWEECVQMCWRDKSNETTGGNEAQTREGKNPQRNQGGAKRLQKERKNPPKVGDTFQELHSQHSLISPSYKAVWDESIIILINTNNYFGVRYSFATVLIATVASSPPPADPRLHTAALQTGSTRTLYSLAAEHINASWSQQRWALGEWRRQNGTACLIQFHTHHMRKVPRVDTGPKGKPVYPTNLLLQVLSACPCSYR